MAFVYIGNQDGSNWVILTQDQEPAPIPVEQRKRRLTLHTMRPGVSAAGLRIGNDLGTHRSYTDLEFTCRYVSSSNLTALRNKFDAYPPQAVEVSLDGGTTKYRALWAEDGLEIRRWEEAEDRYEVTVRLHIIGLQSDFGS